MRSYKEQYKDFCKLEKNIPIFSQDWWLDAVCGEDNWDVALVFNKSNEIIASMPYAYKRKFGKLLIRQPQLTQFIGPYIKPKVGISYTKQLSREMKVMSELIKQIPRFLYFSQNFSMNVTNWLPFYWSGFKQTTRYSYVINDIQSIDDVVKGFAHAKRKNLKRAESLVKVSFDLPPEEFYKNHELTLGKQGEKCTYSYETFKRIYEATQANKASIILSATDSEGNLHGALFVIFDNNKAYDLISTIDPDFRNSGAATLLVREAIVYVSRFVHQFDFEGSMIKGVEKSFRQFGAEQRPYFNIYKSSSRALSALLGYGGR